MEEETSSFVMNLRIALQSKEENAFDDVFKTTDEELISFSVQQLSENQFEVLFLRAIKKRAILWVTHMMKARPDYFKHSQKLSNYLKSLQIPEQSDSKLALQVSGKLEFIAN